MPKIAKELSALEVGRLTVPGFHAVGGVPGLHLQVSAQGARSWILRVKIGAHRRDMGLGAYPGVTLAQAREKARQARASVEQGHDPILERERAKSRLLAEQGACATFAEAAAAYIKAKAPEWKGSKSKAQWESSLATYAFPQLGAMHVRDISQAHVVRVLEPIWTIKTETASRLRGRIENVLDWARVHGYREGDNPARWRGHLDKLLAAPSKVARVEHHPAITVEDAPAFYQQLKLRDGLGARALQFAMLTAARSGEVRGATWSEIDLDKAVWIVPAGRMKAGKEHRVPLSAEAATLLRQLPRLDGTDLVFPAPRGQQLSDMSLSAVMRRMGLKEVPHGLRSTFRDWAGERTNYPRDMAEMALAHGIGNAAEAAYRRGDMAEKRRSMMDDWSDFLLTPNH